MPNAYHSLMHQKVQVNLEFASLDLRRIARIHYLFLSFYISVELNYCRDYKIPLLPLDILIAQFVISQIATRPLSIRNISHSLYAW